MKPTSQSWGTVEEMVLTDIAKWKSKVGTLPLRRGEEAALVEDALVMPTGKGVAAVTIGRLHWELTPPSNYTGYCETKDDWMLVSGTEFKVSIRSTHGAPLFFPLQVCPQSDEVAVLGSQALLPLSMQNLGLREESLGTEVSIDNLNVDDKLSNNLLLRFFDAEETTASQKIVGENFNTPFLRCVRDLQTAKSVSDVLETILGLSAAYDITLQALHQEQEETFDLTSCFYNEQVWEKDCSSKSGCLWVRQQVSHAARKCQTAAAATAEVADVGARVFVDLYTKPSEVPHAFQFKRDDKPNSDVVEDLGDTAMDECSDEVDPDSTPSLPLEQDGLMSGLSSALEEQKPSATQHHWSSVDFGQAGAANLDGPPLKILNIMDCDQFGIGDIQGGGNNPTGTLLRTNSFGSSWQSDVGNDTSSESSWEVVRPLKNESTAGDEADAFGAELSDAESLDVMLRDLDPFGKRECSPLINEFFSLKMNSATCSADNSDQEQSSCVQEERETKVLERLASWSSSTSSNWTDHEILSSASSAKKTPTGPLQTLAEEPPCDPDISRMYRSYVFRAATEGNVLQWCSCKFNKLRCSIELKFQVGCFMEDDLATLSTGISRESPLHVEIFLDSTNVRESLLQGDVRVSAHQGVPFGYRGSWKNTGAKTAVLPPVAGLSCYIPHLVRQYLKQEVHAKRARSGYEFPEGELITGLMQYVVAQLVFIKHTCCVCNHETPSDLLTSIVPRPCEKNLCQALYGAWLAVTPPAVVELSTIEDWLKACFDEDLLYEAFKKHYVTYGMWNGTYKEKVERVAKWLGSTILYAGKSWLKLAVPKPKIDDKFNEQNETATGAAETDANTDAKTQAPKRRRTSLKLSDADSRANRWAQTSGPPPASPPESPPSSPDSSDVFIMGQQQHEFERFGFSNGTRIGNFVLDSDPSPILELDAPGPSLSSLSNQQQPGENLASTSAFSLCGTSSSTAQQGSEPSLRSLSKQQQPGENLASTSAFSLCGTSSSTAQQGSEPSSFMAASAGPPKRSPGPARGETSSRSENKGWGVEKMLKVMVEEERRSPSQDPRSMIRRIQELRILYAQAAQGEESTSQGRRIHGESSSLREAPASWEDLIDEEY